MYLMAPLHLQGEIKGFSSFWQVKRQIRHIISWQLEYDKLIFEIGLSISMRDDSCYNLHNLYLVFPIFIISCS